MNFNTLVTRSPVEKCRISAGSLVTLATDTKTEFKLPLDLVFKCDEDGGEMAASGATSKLEPDHAPTDIGRPTKASSTEGTIPKNPWTTGSGAAGAENRGGGKQEEDELNRLLLPYQWELGELRPILMTVKRTLLAALTQERNASERSLSSLADLRTSVSVDCFDALNFDASFRSYETAIANAYPIVKRFQGVGASPGREIAV